MELEKIKNDILGKDYSLSLAYISEKKSKAINKKYRGQTKPTNVLSFSLGKNSGEILLCRSVIKKELQKFGRNFSELVQFLVIHGMLHLKGMQHSSRMERAEEKYDQKYFRRHRRRIRYDQSSGGRIHQGRKKS